METLGGVGKTTSQEALFAILKNLDFLILFIYFLLTSGRKLLKVWNRRSGMPDLFVSVLCCFFPVSILFFSSRTLAIGKLLGSFKYVFL